VERGVAKVEKMTFFVPDWHKGKYRIRCYEATFALLSIYFYIYMFKKTTMELQHNYTVEEVLEIVNTMSNKDKQTIKTALFIDEAEFERLVKEDFAKYETTFKALA
jgi:hypothetical protein